MKLSHSSFREERKSSFSKIPLIFGAFAILGCAPINESRRNVEAPISEKQPTPTLKQIATTLTLLESQKVFLAYVTPENTTSDLENPNVTFTYKNGSEKWKTINGCERIHICDVSGVLALKSGTLTIRADFTPDSSSPYLPSSAEYPFY